MSLIVLAKGLTAMFDHKEIDMLKPNDGAVVYSCYLHHWDRFNEWKYRVRLNLDRRWQIKKRRFMRGTVLDVPPSDEELVLLASWKELSNTQNPTSCMICNWKWRENSSPDRYSEREVVEYRAEEDNSPFLLAL